jgi:hypothetical protein
MDPVAADPTPPVDPSTPPPTPQPLTAREAEMLAFERQWWKFPGAKEHAIRELFDLSATRYYQVVNTLIDRPEALAHDPMLVKRLLRTRQIRRRSGSARSLDAHG